MIQVYQANISRNIRESQLQKYLEAGWSQSAQVQAEEQIVLKPPARVKAAVKEADDDAIISKGE
jgi:hypothetical protein